MSAEPAVAGLSAQQTEHFQHEGYVILEGFLERESNDRLIAEVDGLTADRANGARPLLTSFREMGLLTSHPPMMAMIESLMGPRFAMHHIHSSRHDAGHSGVHWHQDYEQEPHTNRSHVMVHVFYYLNGLNGEIGDLLVLPGSQTVVVQTSLGLFGTEDLPGSVCVDRLPPGSAVIVHSAVWHARRPKPGGEDRSGATSSTSPTASTASSGRRTAPWKRSIGRRFGRAATAAAATGTSTTPPGSSIGGR